MSFERLKRDLTAYDGHSNLALNERLALFRSLEAELTALTGENLENCLLTEQDCDSSDVISDIAWLGNLFHKLYTQNQSVVERHSSRFIRRFLTDADGATLSLDEELKGLREAQKSKNEMQAKNAELEKAIAAIKLDMANMDQVKLRYYELTEQKRLEEQRFAATSPYDLEGAQKELDEIRQKIIDKQLLYQTQKERMNMEQSKCRQELDNWIDKIADLSADNTQLEAKITEHQKIANELLVKKAQLDSELASLGVDTLKEEIDKLTSDIMTSTQQREHDVKMRADLQVELSQVQESNESFFRNYIDPIQRELTTAQSQTEQLEAEQKECVELLKERNEKILQIKKSIPELKDKLDVQSSNLQAAEAMLLKNEEKFNNITSELNEKTSRKKQLDDEILAAEANRLSIETQITTLEMQSIPAINEKITALNEEQDSLAQREEQLNAELAALEKLIEEKTAIIEEAKESREKNHSESVRLSADLENLIQENKELEQSLLAKNPEETRQKLQNEKARLLEALEEADELSKSLEEKKTELREQTALNDELSKELKSTQNDYEELKKCCAILEKRISEIKTPEYINEIEALQKRQEFLLDVSDSLRSLKSQLLPDADIRNDAEFIHEAISVIKKQSDSLHNQLIILKDRVKENIL